jgi:peptidoglycan/xylan/chitin deacetylase (PgdA/CDA1 family)
MHVQAFDGCVFLLRVDCEHTEAMRWSGSEAVEAVDLLRLLALLGEVAVPATFAFVGTTAIRFPELARACVAQSHVIAGHSMRHAGPYAERPDEWQRSDMQEMIAAIQQTCGRRVHGLAAPGHGVIDTATIRAAASVGLDYVLNLTITSPCYKALGPAPGLPPSVLIPAARLQFVWDWTTLQPGWPPFSASEAMQQWMATIDTAARAQGTVSLIIHPWIVEANQEYAVIAEVQEYARSKRASFATFDEIVSPGAAADHDAPLEVR